MNNEQFKVLDEHWMKEVQTILDAGGRIDVNDRFSEFRQAAEIGGTKLFDEMKARYRKHLVKYNNLLLRFAGCNVPSEPLRKHGAGIINYIRLIHAYLNREEKGYVACALPECGGEDLCPECQEQDDSTTGNIRASRR